MEYKALVEEAVTTLTLLGLSPRLIPSYRNKIDHGDIDILCQRSMVDGEKVARVLGAEKTKPNGDCLSLLWRGAQLDLIFAKKSDMDSTYGYLAWPDLGNFVGRIAKTYGFRYGQLGLGRWIENQHGQRAHVAALSNSTRDILEFFDLDYQRWSEGFDDAWDIYAFVTSSAFFDRSIFLERSLDHRARVRNKKRPVYSGLIEWCQGKELPSFLETPRDSSWWDNRCDQYFGKAWRGEVSKWKEDEMRKAAVKRKFNGRWAERLSGLTGLELSDAMREFRQKREGVFEDWVLNTPQENIDIEFAKIAKGREG